MFRCHSIRVYRAVYVERWGAEWMFPLVVASAGMITPKKLFAVAAVLAAVAGAAFTVGGHVGAVEASTAAVQSTFEWRHDDHGAFRFWDSRSLYEYQNRGGILNPGEERHIFIPSPWPPTGTDFPPGGPTQVLLNVTVVVPDTGPPANGWVSLYPYEFRNTSAINWDRPGEYANNVLVAVGHTTVDTRTGPSTSYGFNILVAGSGPVHVILDVEAWTV